MKKGQIKVGSIIEAGTRGNMITGKVKLIIGGEGHGKANLYKCEFLNPVSIRNTIEGVDSLSKARTTHILYEKQFIVLDY